MEFREIQECVLDAHKDLVQEIHSLSEESFMLSRENKWNAGQHLKHILLCFSPFERTLAVPSILEKFGASGKRSRSYREFKEQFESHVGNMESLDKFIPTQVMFSEREELSEELLRSTVKTLDLLGELSEEELDSYQAPHPRIGLLTLREFFYFNEFHARHHLDLVRKELDFKV